MNIYEQIKSTVEKFNTSTQVFLFANYRADMETNENEGNSVVYIYTDFEGESARQSGSDSIISKDKFVIDFLDVDTNDNVDNDNKDEYVEPSSYEIYIQQKLFANGVLSKWLRDHENTFAFRARESQKWRTKPMFRIYGNRMTGVRCTINFPYHDPFACVPKT